MSVSAGRYARANASARAMLSQLLTAEQRRSLMAAASLRDAIQLLGATVYAPALDALPGDDVTLQSVQRSLQRELVNAHERAIHLLQGAPRVLVEAMLQRFEVDNLKAILRAVAAGRAGETAALSLVPLDRHSRLPLADLCAARTPAALVDALGDLHYAAVLRSALDRYRHERSLFPLELALDLDYYRHLWATLDALPSPDRRVASRLVGIWYDTINVDWMLRYKMLYQLAPEEVFNYTLSHGFKIDSAVVWRAASAPDLSTLIATLPDPYRQLLQRSAGPEATMERFEAALHRHLVGVARRGLVGYPFHIGVVIAFLLLKEAEVHDLQSILEGKRYGRAGREIEAFLWGDR